MFSSLRSRLVLSYALVVVLTLFIAGAGLLLLLQDFEGSILAQRLVAAVGPAAVQARNLEVQGRPPEEIVSQVREQIDASWRVLLVNDQRTLIGDSSGTQAGHKLPANIPAVLTVAPRRAVTGRVALDGRQYAYAALPIGRQGESRVTLILAAIPRPFAGALGDLAGPLASAGAIALVVAIIIGLVLAASIARPLRRLTTATEEIARGNYSAFIAPEGSDEVGRLAASFNTMVDAVRRSQQVQKDFVANVSHELKTPLTSIQGFSQAIAEGAVRDLEGAQRAAKLIYAESQRMARLVGDLLTLARLDAGDVTMNHAMVDLAQVLPGWVERFQPRAAEAGVSLSVSVDSAPRVEADAERLEQAVSNLLDNAIKYNRVGGQVVVSAARRTITVSPAHKPAPDKQWAVISVSDTGLGIPESGRSRLFERFYRADKARAAGGSGLGLAIVHEIVDAHQGHVEVESEEGKGTTLSVWLPAAPKN